MTIRTSNLRPSTRGAVRSIFLWRRTVRLQ